MYTLLTKIPAINPCDSKGMINEEYVNFLKGKYLPNNIKNLEFEIDSVNQKFSFKVSESQEMSYKLVGPAHFKNNENGEVILLDIHNPNFSLDRNKFTQATQVDYDYYQNKLNKNNDNSKLYKIVQEIIFMNESDDSDDEDPYFRGNIDEYLKK